MNFYVSNIGTWAGSLSLLAWIVYIVFKCFIQESMKSKFAKELQNLKDKNQKELEGFKAGYKKVLDENQIRFSKIYLERAEAIKELYKLLITAKNNIETLNKFCSSFLLTRKEYGIIEHSELSPKDKRYFDDARKAAWSFYEFFECNAFLFDDTIDKKIQHLYKTSISIIVDRTHDGDWASIKKALNDFENQFCPIIDELRKKFRTILNGEEVHDAQ